MTLFNLEKNKKENSKNKAKSLRVGISGASGSLGLALTKSFRSKGFFVIGLTHNSKSNKSNGSTGPNEWIKWQCGKEFLLKEHLKKIDILILNHGVYDVSKKNSNYESSIEINALIKLLVFCLNSKALPLKMSSSNASPTIAFPSGTIDSPLANLSVVTIYS